MSNFCIKCGSKNDDSATVCSICGTMLSTAGGNAAGNLSFTNISADYSKLSTTNRLLDNNHIREYDNNNEFFYELSEDTGFLATEYKVLNSIRNTGLIRCKQFMYNGKIALFYCTESYKPLKLLLSAMDSVTFSVILENIIDGIIKIDDNGFLSGTALDIRINRIYVDTDNNDVLFTYLPINRRCYEDIMFMEKQIRDDLAYIITSLPNLQTDNNIRIAKIMKEPTCSFGNLTSIIRQNRSVSNNSGS